VNGRREQPLLISSFFMPSRSPAPVASAKGARARHQAIKELPRSSARAAIEAPVCGTMRDYTQAAIVLRHFLKTAAVMLALLTAYATLAESAVDVRSLPKPTGYVSDLAGVVGAQDKQQLEQVGTAVEQQLGVQFALVTIDSIGDQPIRDFALDMAREWGVGIKKDNQGVLLLLAIKDRKSDIETGRGIEPYITDGFAGSTLRAMRPDLQQGEYGPALLTAAQSMAAQIAQGKGIAFTGAVPQRRARPPDRHPGIGIPGPLILMGIFLLFWLLGRGGRRGGGYRGGGGGGFIPGLILGSMLGGRRGDDGWRGGGGGGFGGDSGGGGGFGGFGGGDFGGGGASSDW